MISVKKTLAALAFTFSLGSPCYAWTADVVDQIRDALDDPDCVSLLDWNITVHLLNYDPRDPASNTREAAAMLRDIGSALEDAKSFDITVGGQISQTGIDEVGRAVDTNVIEAELSAISQAAATVWLGRAIPGQYGDELPVTLFLRDFLGEELALTCIISFDVIMRHHLQNSSSPPLLFDNFPPPPPPFQSARRAIEKTPTRKPQQRFSKWAPSAKTIELTDKGLVGAQRYAERFLSDIAYAIRDDHGESIDAVAASGLVLLEFHVRFSEQSVDVRVKRSSGNDELDDAVLRAAKSATSAEWLFPPSNGSFTTQIAFQID